MSIFLSPSSERNFCFLLDKSKNSDGKEPLEGEKVKIWISKELLAVASPVFKTMLYGEFKEANTEEPIYLPGKTDEDFLKFLDCLFQYPTRKDIDESNVETILRLSDEYQVETLIKECDKYYESLIRSKYVGDSTVLDFLPILWKNKLNRSLNILVPYMAALDIERLARHRLQSDLKLDGIDGFYSTIYEAKCRRNSHEKHSCYGRPSCYKCGVDKSVIGSSEYLECLKFLKCGSKNYVCLCGYDFERLPLNK